MVEYRRRGKRRYDPFEGIERITSHPARPGKIRSRATHGVEGFTMQDYLSIQDVAELTGADDTTVRRWIATGVLKASRIGPRLVRIRRDDLDAAFKAVN
ncbi:MAG: excisionase family DNA binding protein [Rhodococcus sp. (in: high G+C Gram-positive bacteria)]